MDNIKKQKYEVFCEKNYVPIYSKPWWMDAVCGEENWDVWLYENGSEVLAAMPYFMKERGKYRYITKPPLTQNNGIIFSYYDNMGLIAKQNFEEKVINEANLYIENLEIDVYEQQFQYSFTNWLPFFWNRYQAITRYTYVIEETKDLGIVWEKIYGNRRKKIKKGLKNTEYREDLSEKDFFEENKKIYYKQGLDSPISYELWKRVYKACQIHNAGKIMCRRTPDEIVASISFVVWDEKCVYKLIGGPIPEMANLEAHSAMTWNEIEFAHKQGLKYDFEGSVIKRISKSFREFGGEPKPYFRIRKIFNPEIIRNEAEETIKNSNLEG